MKPFINKYITYTYTYYTHIINYRFMKNNVCWSNAPLGCKWSHCAPILKPYFR